MLPWGCAPVGLWWTPARSGSQSPPKTQGSAFRHSAYSLFMFIIHVHDSWFTIHASWFMFRNSSFSIHAFMFSVHLQVQQPNDDARPCDEVHR